MSPWKPASLGKPASFNFFLNFTRILKKLSNISKNGSTMLRVFLLFDYAKLPFKRAIRPPIKESLNFFGRGPQDELARQIVLKFFQNNRFLSSDNSINLWVLTSLCLIFAFMGALFCEKTSWIRTNTKKLKIITLKYN